MSKTYKILIWVIAVILLLPVLFTLITLTSAAVPAHAATRAYNCDRHSWTGSVGVRPYPWATADWRMRARVCWWTQHSPKHPDGQVIDRKTKTSVRYDVTSFGHTISFTVWPYRKYNVSQPSDAFTEYKGIWSRWRQCPQDVCAPTGDFVIGWRFMSPYIIRRSPYTMSDMWDFRWHEGSPGQNPDRIDQLIKLNP